jgi:PAS domain S-box-containing protein
MRSILFGASSDTARALAEPLVTEGYAPEVRIVEGPLASDDDVEATRGTTVVFIHFALGIDATVDLCHRIHAAADGGVPALLAIIGEPDEADARRLIAAGTTMVFASRPESIAVRSRFLFKAAKGRAELAQTIAELRAAEDRNRRLEREHRAVLERTPLGVFVHRDGRLVWANRQAGMLLGAPDPSALIGRGVDLLHDASRPAIEQRIQDRNSGKEITPYEQTLVRHDGTALQLWIAGMPTLFEGEPAAIAFAVDMTEQRRLEAQLVASERLASLGRLAASVGHEINNPLTYVLGNLELATRALRDGVVPPDLLEMLQAALGGAEQVSRIVEDLRLFAQPKSEVLAAVDVRTVVESCIRMTGGELRHRARLVQELDGIPPVLASEPRLAQVITNLLLNAAHALPRGAADAQTVKLVARVDGDHVELRIEDTGEGVPPEHLPHVFEPFYTTRTERGGTGLGLAICRTLMAAQNGEIRIESEPGAGTCVILRLHIAVAVDAPPAVVQRRSTVTPRRVLLVDDDPQILELMRRSLVRHDVAIASSGREALRRLEQGERFDVIVCDLVMPDGSGIDVYDGIRRLMPGFERRVIFMTGGIVTSVSPSAVATLPNTCLHKPFPVETLVDEIERTAAL